MSSNPPRRPPAPKPPQSQYPLPKITSPNYKSNERKVTALLVAIPLTVVTSYMLYRRVVLGEEPKKFSELSEDEKSKKKILEVR